MARNSRLAFVIHDLNPYGGQDRSTLEIARRLSRRWPVDVYSFTLDDPLRESWGELAFHRVRPNLRHPVMAKTTYFAGAVASELAWARLPAVGSGRSLVHATGACSLVSDVVQVQFVSAAWKEARAKLPPEVARARPAEGVLGKGAALYHEALLRYNVGLEKIAFRPSKTYIPIARCVASELERHFGLRERMHVIHHGVDPEMFRPAEDAETRADRSRLRAELGIGDDEIVVLFVGAYARKGLAASIEAISRLPREILGKVRLLGMGGGDREAFLDRARALGIGDRVLLPGSSREIARYYRAGDVFLLPTLYEPFGLVILEAMATGLPPVVSAIAGASELIDDGRNGLLIRDPADPREIAELLKGLLADPVAREAMGRAARETAAARSWDRVADEYAAVLEPLLTAKGRS